MWLSYLIKFKWVFGVIGAVASLYSITGYFETKGYNRAVVEIQGRVNVEIQKATEKALNKATKEMQVALNKQQVVHDAELKRIKNERIVEIEHKKVIEYVDRIEVKNECSTVNDSIVRVLNDSIRNSNATGN